MDYENKGCDRFGRRIEGNENEENMAKAAVAENIVVEESNRCEGGSEKASWTSDSFTYKDEKKSSFFNLSKKGISGLVAICIIIACCFGVGGAAVLAKNGIFDDINLSSEESAQTQTNGKVTLGQGSGTTLENATGSDLTIAEIYAMTSASVVEIKTEKTINDTWMRQFVTEGAGSGVIVSSDGYIVTNNHVIEGASTITVTTNDGTIYDASLVATDEQEDVAVIKIDGKNLTSAVYGNSDEVVVGELAVVIGNPLGSLGGSVTAGIISALNREVTIDGKTMTLMQTDAAINPGNSGGGLFNSKGELIGIVNAKTAGTEIDGIGFAIPVNKVSEVASQLVKNGYVKGRAYIGITYVDCTSIQNALSYGVRNLGIYVADVIEDNAKKGGLEKGDMLYYVGDTKISSSADLSKALQGKKVGEKIKITVVRNDEIIDLEVTLSEKKN